MITRIFESNMSKLTNDLDQLSVLVCTAGVSRGERQETLYSLRNLGMQAATLVFAA